MAQPTAKADRPPVDATVLSSAFLTETAVLEKRPVYCKNTVPLWDAPRLSAEHASRNLSGHHNGTPREIQTPPRRPENFAAAGT
jgi:hypothetical protein